MRKRERKESKRYLIISLILSMCLLHIFFLLILLRYVLEESKRKKNLKSPFYRIKPKKSFIRKKKKRIYFNQHLISVCYHLTSFWHNRSLKWWIKRNKEEKNTNTLSHFSHIKAAKWARLMKNNYVNSTWGIIVYTTFMIIWYETRDNWRSHDTSMWNIEIDWLTRTKKGNEWKSLIFHVFTQNKWRSTQPCILCFLLSHYQRNKFQFSEFSPGFYFFHDHLL